MELPAVPHPVLTNQPRGRAHLPALREQGRQQVRAARRTRCQGPPSPAHPSQRPTPPSGRAQQVCCRPREEIGHHADARTDTRTAACGPTALGLCALLRCLSREKQKLCRNPNRPEGQAQHRLPAVTTVTTTAQDRGRHARNLLAAWAAAAGGCPWGACPWGSLLHPGVCSGPGPRERSACLCPTTAQAPQGPRASSLLLCTPGLVLGWGRTKPGTHLPSALNKAPFWKIPERLGPNGGPQHPV